jgi:hypothetical protein
MPDFLSRDRLAVLAALVAPLAVAANGYRLAGILAALSVAVWFDFSRSTRAE